MAHFLEKWESQSISNQRLVAEEALIIAVAEKIWEEMERKNISRTALADALGTSKPNVTQLLDGTRNLTLRKLANIAFVLGVKPVLDFKEDNVIRCEWTESDAPVLQLNRVVSSPVRVPCAVSNNDDWTFPECAAHG